MGGDAKVTADGVVATDLTAVKHATQEEARELFVIEPISITVSGPSGRTVPETWQTHGRAVYRLTQTVLIKACLNGGRTQGEHPSVPVTAEEIAADARRVAEAGAGAVHVHPRDVRGKETLDPAPCGDAVASIRGLAPDLPIGLTTAAWIAPHPDRLRLIERWDPPPDFASVNVSEEGTADLCRVLADRGIQPEGGLVEAERWPGWRTSRTPAGSAS